MWPVQCTTMIPPYQECLQCVLQSVRGGFTYNPDDINIFRYGARRGSVNKI
jgi:hypothetical protein